MEPRGELKSRLRSLWRSDAGRLKRGGSNADRARVILIDDARVADGRACGFSAALILFGDIFSFVNIFSFPVSKGEISHTFRGCDDEREVDG